MRLSITSTLLGPGTSVPPGETLSHCLKLCREAGFLYVDLDFGALVRPGFPLSGEDWEEQTERIGRQGQELGLSFEKVMIEPGRSIVAEAGYTLYTVGFTKETRNSGRGRDTF